MNCTYYIMDMAQKNNGMVTARMVSQAGIARGSLAHLEKTGRLQRVERGVYVLPEVLEDELFALQSRFARGVFSLGTALFLHGLSDRTPAAWHMAFPATYNLSGPKAVGIICHGSSAALYGLGVESVRTPGGHMVRAYCAERSICDALRPVNHVDTQTALDALKGYLARAGRDMPLLSEYARATGVEGRLRPYLEALL